MAESHEGRDGGPGAGKLVPDELQQQPVASPVRSSESEPQQFVSQLDL